MFQIRHDETTNKQEKFMQSHHEAKDLLLTCIAAVEANTASHSSSMVLSCADMMASSDINAFSFST